VLGRIELKGPLVDKNGKIISQALMDITGLIKAALKELNQQSAANTVVIDLLGMNVTQRSQVKTDVTAGAKPGRTRVIFLE